MFICGLEEFFFAKHLPISTASIQSSDSLYSVIAPHKYPITQTLGSFFVETKKLFVDTLQMIHPTK